MTYTSEQVEVRECYDKIGYGFITEGKCYLKRCFQCGRENYSLNVRTGKCTWCDYDMNKDKRWSDNETTIKQRI